MHVHEIDDGAEARAVDEIADRAAEDEPDRDHARQTTGGQHAQRHASQHEQRDDRERGHQPAPRRLQRAEQPEGEPGIHDERQREPAVGEHDGMAGYEVRERGGLADLIRHDDDRGEQEDERHRARVTTRTHRAHSVGWAGSRPTSSLRVQHRSHLSPAARSTPMTSPGMSWLS